MEGTIDKRHHPLVVLRESIDNEKVEQVVICRGAKIQKNINQFILGKWILPDKSYSMRLERKVVKVLFFMKHMCTKLGHKVLSLVHYDWLHMCVLI